MKLLEKTLYSGVVFLALYVVISMGLRMFNVTTSYMSHLIGGTIAIVASLILFTLLLIKKQ